MSMFLCFFVCLSISASLSASVSVSVSVLSSPGASGAVFKGELRLKGPARAGEPPPSVSTTTIALKQIFIPLWEDEAKELVRQFEREAGLLSELRHANVVRFFGTSRWILLVTADILHFVRIVLTI